MPGMRDHSPKGRRIGFDEALAIILDRSRLVPAIQIPLQDAPGAVIAENVIADADYPRSDMAEKVAFAVSSLLTGQACEMPPPALHVNEAAFASHPAEEYEPTCQINSGARVPKGGDSVVASKSSGIQPQRRPPTVRAAGHRSKYPSVGRGCGSRRNGVTARRADRRRAIWGA